MRIIAFEPKHLEILNPRSFEGKEMFLLGDVQERAKEYLRYGPAFTGIEGEQIIGCVGLVVLWPGVAEAWAVSTPLWPSKAKSVHKAITHGLKELSATLGLWRIQTAIHSEHVVSLRWLLRMGFNEEGYMSGYGPDGATYLRLALTDLTKCHPQKIEADNKGGPTKDIDQHGPEKQYDPENKTDSQTVTCIHIKPPESTDTDIVGESQCHL